MDRQIETLNSGKGDGGRWMLVGRKSVEICGKVRQSADCVGLPLASFASRPSASITTAESTIIFGLSSAEACSRR